MTPRDRIDVWAIGLNPEEIQPPRNEQGGFQPESAAAPLMAARPIASGVRVLSSGDAQAENVTASGQGVARNVTYFLELPELSVSAYLAAASSSQVRYVLNVNGMANVTKPPPRPKPIEILTHEEGVNG
jgi:1,6-anhydro-N-acetylmuramate kinase